MFFLFLPGLCRQWGHPMLGLIPWLSTSREKESAVGKAQGTRRRYFKFLHMNILCVWQVPAWYFQTLQPVFLNSEYRVFEGNSKVNPKA